MHQNTYSSPHDLDRISLLVQFINEINRQIGKSYLNAKSDGSDVYEQAQSWLPYLRYIQTENFQQVFENCVITRTNTSSQLTVQNLLDSSRHLINANRIQPITEKKTNPHCSNCKGLGWELVEMWLPHPDDEFSTPQPYQMASQCKCENHPAIMPDRDFVSRLMRVLATHHPGGIPNVAMEQRAAEKLSELGYDLDDVYQFCGGDDPLSLIPVVRGIGRWYFQKEVKNLKVPMNEIARIAMQVIGSPISEAAMEADRKKRIQLSTQRQAEIAMEVEA